MQKRNMLMSVALITIGVLWGDAAQAQSLGDMSGGTKSSATSKAKKKKGEGKRDPREFGLMTFDAWLGFGGFFYPHLEPGLDVGVVPLWDNNLTVSVGGSLEAGYCVGCFLFDLAARLSGSDLNVRSWYVAPFLRANLHINAIGRFIDMPELDIYGGFMGGPALHSWKVESGSDDAKLDFTSTILTAGPVAGVRYLVNRRFFLAVEARYLLSFNNSTATLTASDGTSYSFDTRDVTRSGGDYNLAVGLRF